MIKKNWFIHLISGLIPLSIFILYTYINKLIPFGEQILNIYDSFTQYPGMLLELKNSLLTGNFFYTFHAGLGFNLLGTLSYYAASPLNILSVFATSTNYPYFSMIMIYIRFFLLGFVSSFYFKNKTDNKLYITLFSTIYALMGYTVTYYYNYIWMDCVILLPLVILGLENLLNDKKPTLYIISLTLCIICNYYIGFMICVFTFLCFLYLVIDKKNKLKLFKKYLYISFICGLMGLIVILPSYYALRTGKASLYSHTDYSGLVKNGKALFYSLTPGTYESGDQAYGPAQVYSSLLVLVLTVFYFFNNKFSRKEKIIAALILMFFVASFNIKALNYSWQFFQRPIWWQSRFSFTFSFFLMMLSIKTLVNIDKTNITLFYRVTMMIILILLIAIGYMEYFMGKPAHKYHYFFVGFSILFIIESFFMIDKKMIPLILLLTFMDLNINTYNSVKQNSNYKSYLDNYGLVKKIGPSLEKIDKENEYFYRFEILNDYSSDDGLFFNFNGVNYFNSARNVKVIYFLKNLGFKVADSCHANIIILDPLVLSLLNIKYVYGDMPYFVDTKYEHIKENKYPLSLGFMASENIKDLKLKDYTKKDNGYGEYKNNTSALVNALTGKKFNIYKKINNTQFDFDHYTNYSTARYTFKADKDYIVFPIQSVFNEVYINKRLANINNIDGSIKIKKGDLVTLNYNIKKQRLSEVEYTLFDIKEYEKAMSILSQSKLMVNKKHSLVNILNGKINVQKKGTLFTTIEYEKGMKVYVDGMEVKPNILFDSLISLDLDKGKHDIRITYIPQGFIPGLFSFIIGLILALNLKKNYNIIGERK